MKSRKEHTCQLVAMVALSMVLMGGMPSAFCAAAPPEPDDIVIGMSAAFMGSSHGLGIELYRGAMAYLEHVNSNGGVHGRKVRIRTYDDSYNPALAIKNTIKLTNDEEVLLLFGYVGTPTVTRVLPLLKLNQEKAMLLFFPFTGAQPQRQYPYDRFVFNLRASYSQETEKLVTFFVSDNKKKIAIFYQADAYGRSGWSGVRSALAKHDLTIAAEATYKRGTKFTERFDLQVRALKKVSPDAIISIGSYCACAGFIRDARDAGLDVPIANVSFVGSDNLLNKLEDAGENSPTDYTRSLINSQVVPSYEDLSFPVVKQYRALMDQYKPDAPADISDKSYIPDKYSFVGLEGFVNAKVLVEVLKKLEGNLSRDRIKVATESISGLDIGLKEDISFSSSKHQGLNSVYLTTVKDGRFVSIPETGDRPEVGDERE